MSSTPHTEPLEEHTHHDRREVEWQLASSDLSSVRRWLEDHRSIGGLVLEARSPLQIFDTYLDTEDWRIHRAGYALRLRSEDGRAEATLKSLRSRSTEMADRRELSEALETRESDSIARSKGPVGMRVQAVSGAQSLQPLFEVRTSRQRYAVHAANEPEPLGEIALDETVICRPQGQPHTSMQRVEVEALTEAHEPLQALVKALRSGCGLESAADNKFSQGLKSAGLAPAPPPELAPTEVNASMPIHEVALANLRRYLSLWDLHEPGARLGDDPEELHDLRVAGRRMDGVLRQFGKHLPPTLVQIRPTLKKVLRALGETRDLDVALLELGAFDRALTEADRTNLDPLRQYLHSQRARARTRMLSLLDSAEIQRNFDALRLGLAHFPDAAPGPGAAAVEVVPELIRRRYKKVRKGADALAADSPMESYHAVRGNVKKLRYLLESVAVIFGKPANGMVRSLRRWQEWLGTQQDADVADRRLRVLAAAPPKSLPPETLFVMGRLAAHQAKCAAKARKQHPRAYRKVRARWRALKGRLADGEPRALDLPVAGP